MKATIEVTELTRSELVNLLSDGLSGSEWLGVEYDKNKWNAVSEKCGDCFEDKLVDLLLAGESIRLIDYEQTSDSETDETEGGRGVWMRDEYRECFVAAYDITLGDILAACSTPEGYGLATEIFITETGDYYTANSLLQIAMFGEVLYG